jgi:tetratricopeptide (TPR) repeat protein
MLIRLLSIFLIMLFASTATAQSQGNDYYAAKSDPQLSGLLHRVELYHLQQGLNQIKSRQYDSARADFDFILRYFPNHPRALILMSDLCQIIKDRRCNAEAYFDKGLQINPNNSGIHLIKGVYLQRFGKLDEAIESYKQALAISPDSANAHYNLGLAYFAQKQYAAANEHAQRAYALNPTLPAALRSKLIAGNTWKTSEFEPSEQAQLAVEAAPFKSVRDPSVIDGESR